MPGFSQNVYAFILDTTQYKERPNIPGQPAGKIGDIQSDQLEIIKELVEREKEGSTIILMGHHPFKQLKKGAQDEIDLLITQHKIPVYISAHTHKGRYFSNGNSEKWLELNVGSITDWPIEFRNFSLCEIADTPEKLLICSKLYRIPEFWDEEPKYKKLTDIKKEDWNADNKENYRFLSRD